MNKIHLQKGQNFLYSAKQFKQGSHYLSQNIKKKKWFKIYLKIK